MERAIFKNRREAGRRLAKKLSDRGYKRGNTLVLGIPPGGVIVGEEVAKALSATLDVMVARKLRAPYRPELEIGAVADGDLVVLNEELLRSVGVSQDYLNREIVYQKSEMERRLRYYRGDRPGPEVRGKTVIVVDDGIATGSPFRASLESLLLRHPKRLVAATPVAAKESVEILKALADEVICLHTPVAFVAVTAWYEKFEPLSDDESFAILRRHRAALPLAA